jgi:hypothetical protein
MRSLKALDKPPPNIEWRNPEHRTELEVEHEPRRENRNVNG